MTWLMATDGSPRAIVLGAGVFALCSGAAGGTVLKQMDRLSLTSASMFGMPLARLALIFLWAGIFFAVTLFAQVPLLPPTH
jgi:hypothetical protein